MIAYLMGHANRERSDSRRFVPASLFMFFGAVRRCVGKLHSRTPSVDQMVLRCSASAAAIVHAPKYRAPPSAAPPGASVSSSVPSVSINTPHRLTTVPATGAARQALPIMVSVLQVYEQPNRSWLSKVETGRRRLSSGNIIHSGVDHGLRRAVEHSVGMSAITAP